MHIPCALARYAQNNCIWDLSGLEELAHLDTVNLNNNTLEHLSHLDKCPELHTLLLANNRLESVESIRVLTDCKSLSTLDLQGNKIEDPQVLGSEALSLLLAFTFYRKDDLQGRSGYLVV